MANSFYCRTCNISFDKSCNCTAKCPKCNGYNIVSTSGYNKLIQNSTIKCISCNYYKPIAKINDVDKIHCTYKQSKDITSIIECPLKKW